jgi:predicted RNase H-like nuclease (RuvC/YqgF family)
LRPTQPARLAARRAGGCGVFKRSVHHRLRYVARDIEKCVKQKDATLDFALAESSEQMQTAIFSLIQR